MELFKRRKSPQEDSIIDWSKEKGISKVLGHSKIIGARKFIKNKVDHEKSNFRMFPVYKTLEKIVLGTETWRR